MIGRLKKYFATQRAASDVVRQFSGEMSVADEAEIHKRKSQSEEYQFGLSSSREILAELKGLADDPDLLSLVDKYPEASDEQPSNSRPVVTDVSRPYWPKLAIAATVLMAMTVGWLAIFNQAEPENNILRYVTRTGEQKTVTLKDGSVLTLNTATQVLVDMSEQSRRVIMERGEVYYDIAPDPDRPFTVELGERSVSVLGTEFNIRKSPERFTLAVVEGMVSIHRKAEMASLAAPLFGLEEGAVQITADSQRRVTAGTVVEFDGERREYAAHQEKDIDRFQSWRTGLVSFVNEPLHRVIHELNRYSGKKIFIEDSAIMDFPVRATVRVNRVDVALIGLESSLPIKVVTYFDKVVITGN